MKHKIGLSIKVDKNRIGPLAVDWTELACGCILEDGVTGDVVDVVVVVVVVDSVDSIKVLKPWILN